MARDPRMRKPGTLPHHWVYLSFGTTLAFALISPVSAHFVRLQSIGTRFAISKSRACYTSGVRGPRTFGARFALARAVPAYMA